MKHVLSKNSPAGFWLTPFLTQHISITLETPGWWSVHPIAPLIWHYHNFMFLCLWVNFQFLSALKSHIAVSTKPHLGSHLKHTKQPLKTQCNWSLQHCLPYSFGLWYKKNCWLFVMLYAPKQRSHCWGGWYQWTLAWIAIWWFQASVVHIFIALTI